MSSWRGLPAFPAVGALSLFFSVFFGKNILDSSPRPWETPDGLVSLWIVIRFYQERFFEALHLLEQIENELRSILDVSVSEAFPAAAQIQRAKLALGYIKEQCALTELRTTGDLAANIIRSLHADSKFFPPVSVKEILVQLGLLRDSIRSELERHLFMYIPLAKAEYWQASGPFGKSFLPPDVGAAQWEIDEAGNCYTAGRNTACVFHSMRAAEHGLRKLARKLRVKLTHSGKAMPIEYGDWNDVTTAIKNRIAEARKLPRGAKRQAKLDAYSAAADHCEYMKEIRNNISHARKSYKDGEALDALRQVLAFMQFLGKGMR